MPKFHISWQMQFGNWQHYQTKNNEDDTYRVAKRRAKLTGRRHRITNDSGTLLDICEP